MGCGASTSSHAFVTIMDGPMLYNALMSRDYGEVEKLLAAGAKPDIYYNDEELGKHTYLALATLQEDIAGMTILLNHGASPDPKCGELGNTALHLAAGKGSTSCVYLLVSRGAKVDALNDFADTPLHTASSNGQPACVKLLLSHGARVNAVNRVGETPLHAACEKGHEEVVCALRDAGADAQVLNEKGATPAELALQHGRTACAALLQDTPN